MTRVTRYRSEHNGIPQYSGVPHELSFLNEGGTCDDVHVAPGRPAALVADWFGCGRVEVMAAGRPLVVECDHDGSGIRVVEPMSGMPLAGFDPDAPSRLRLGGRGGTRRGRGSGLRPGRVRLADGTTLRWICPSRAVFECGFVSRSGNIVRFAHDGTAIICVGDGLVSAGSPGDDSTAGTLDVLVLVVLGWFLLLDGGWDLGDDAGEPAGLPAYADIPDAPAVSGSIPAAAFPVPRRPRSRTGSRTEGEVAARPAPRVR